MAPPHFSYHQLLNGIHKIGSCFEVQFLTVPSEKFKLVKLTKIISQNSPLLIIMAGCHGEEPAPSLAIFKNFKLFSKAANKSKVNLVFYPLVNPWGFDRNKRLNRKNVDCNDNWIHEEKEDAAGEIKVIAKDIKKYTPSIFANLHEDDETEREFYIFSFGDKRYEKPLIKVGRQHFPILKDGEYDDIEVKNGVVYNHYDGSAEDFMFHHGCKFSCCTETPSAQSLPIRVRCNSDLILKFIESLKR